MAALQLLRPSEATVSSVRDIFPKQLWLTEQNVKTKVIGLLHYCHSETNLRRVVGLGHVHAAARDLLHWPPQVRMRGIVHRLGCPLSCQLPSKTCLWSWYCQPSETGLHKMFTSAEKVLTRFSRGILQQRLDKYIFFRDVKGILQIFLCLGLLWWTFFAVCTLPFSCPGPCTVW